MDRMAVRPHESSRCTGTLYRNSSTATASARRLLNPSAEPVCLLTPPGGALWPIAARGVLREARGMFREFSQEFDPLAQEIEPLAGAVGNPLRTPECAPV